MIKFKFENFPDSQDKHHIEKEEKAEKQTEKDKKIFSVEGYKNVLRMVERVLGNNEEEEVQKFIKERVKNLEDNTKPVEISAWQNCFYSEYIHPESKITVNFMVEPFHLDDPEIYSILIEALGKYKRQKEDISVEDIIPTAVQHAITEYFGNPFADDQTEKEHRDFYLKRSLAPEEKPPLSVKELKGKRIAVCAEKASLAHNLFKFLGFEAFLILSTKGKLAEKEEFHAYNIIKKDGKYFLFDPANPSVTRSETTGRVEGYSPALYQITGSQFEDLTKGGKIKIIHRDYLSSENRERKAVERERIYGGASV